MAQNLEQRANECTENANQGSYMGGFYQFFYGFSNGYLRTADPIGGLYSHYTDKVTVGGKAWRETKEDGTKPSDINTNSGAYKVGRFFGFLGGALSQLFYGVPQAVSLIYDFFSYRQLKKQGKGSFPWNKKWQKN